MVNLKSDMGAGTGGWTKQNHGKVGAEAMPLENVPETLTLNNVTLLEQTAFTSSSAGSGRSKLMHLNPSSQPAFGSKHSP
jgi:hypothetical protein